MMNDETFMKEVIHLPQLAVSHGNEPLGAVLAKDGEIIFSNENQIYTSSDPIFHVKVGLLRHFCTEMHIMDLREYTPHPSCEPCFMCCDATVWTRLRRLAYGASDIDLCSILHEKGAEHCKVVLEHSLWEPRVTPGVLGDESLKILTAYFPKNTRD